MAPIRRPKAARPFDRETSALGSLEHLHPLEQLTACAFGGGASTPAPDPAAEKQTKIQNRQMMKLQKQQADAATASNALMAEQQTAQTAYLQQMSQPAAPPPEVSTLNASDAADEQRRKAAQRGGFRKTLLAGETVGYTNPATGTKSLLG
jgi:hypothetical protein